MKKGVGTVYLLHFDRPYGPGGGANGRGTARHYLTGRRTSNSVSPSMRRAPGPG